MNLGELAAFVCSHLDGRGIRVTLTGGGCVSLHGGGRHISYDLDFIENLPVTRRKLKAALAEIGFSEERRYFKHPDSEFFLEFPAGPLAVGGEPVREIVELRFATGVLRLLSPTDCVKDRLAAWLHWNDRQCLEQALWVARAQPVDWGEIERWSRQERAVAKFEQFRERFREVNGELERGVVPF
jgi:hypothetical protein